MGRKSSVVDGMKVCGECNELLSIDTYSPSGTQKNGKVKYKANCRICQSILDRNRRATDAAYRERRNKYNRNKRLNADYRENEYAIRRQKYHSDEEYRKHCIEVSKIKNIIRANEDPEGRRNYTRVHAAVYRLNGNAKNWNCSNNCGNTAYDWAMLNTSKSIKQSKHYKWSENIEDYVPLCRSCHRNYDNKYQKLGD